MIDLGPSNPEEGTKDWETSKGESLRHPIQTEMSSNSYASYREMLLAGLNFASSQNYSSGTSRRRSSPAAAVVVGMQ